jgi:quinol monooxygenase YgiN
MVVEYIRYSIDSERAQAFEQGYRRAAAALDASEHCERYEVSRCSDAPTQYVSHRVGPRRRTPGGVSPEPRVPQLL